MWKKSKNQKLDLKSTFYNQDIIVTGGCGSIGSEIVRQLIKFKPKRIRIFDNNESGVFNLQQELNSPSIRPLIGDIRDKPRLKFALKGVDYVFHAAALKHVPLCEYNPFEAVHTNVIGTQNLLESARSENIKKVISISTDKAVHPVNTMGATKLLAEKLVLRAHIGENCRTLFSAVRFGNVLNSVGSVIPIFKEQIKKGGPVTVTSPKMIRYFMSIPQAVNLVLESTKLAKGGDIFILKMDKFKVVDLAQAMIEYHAPKYNHNPQDIKIKITGIRPGEKLDEGLVTSDEELKMLDLGHFFVIPEKGRKIKSSSIQGSDTSLVTKGGPTLSVSQIKNILQQNRI